MSAYPTARSLKKIIEKKYIADVRAMESIQQQGVKILLNCLITCIDERAQDEARYAVFEVSFAGMHRRAALI